MIDKWFLAFRFRLFTHSFHKLFYMRKEMWLGVICWKSCILTLLRSEITVQAYTFFKLGFPSHTTLLKALLKIEEKVDRAVLKMSLSSTGFWKCSTKYNDRKIFWSAAVHNTSLTTDGDRNSKESIKQIHRYLSQKPPKTDLFEGTVW